MDYREIRLIDIARPELVQVQVTPTEVWVNVDGICMFRAKLSQTIEVNDTTVQIAHGEIVFIQKN